jgi:transcriptional regulator with XRE-family HTH domain
VDPPVHRQPFGAAIADIRQSKGLTQKQVADRIPTFYSDDRAYRRIERAERVPDRDAAIAILTVGLAVDDIDRVNTVLALLGYSGLTPAEAGPVATRITQNVSAVRVSTDPVVLDARSVVPRTCIAALVLGGLVSSALLSAVSGHAGFVITATTLYGALFAVSVFLESSLDARSAAVWPVAAAVFALMAASSAAACAADAWLVGTVSPWALPFSLGIFLSTAAAQWVIARTVLSEEPVAPLQFQAHTAQVAHLKNTCYYLVVVVLFWLPSLHCVAVLGRAIRSGHLATVEALVQRRLLLGRDLVAFSPEALWYAFGLLGLLALPMATRLLENLKAHPGLNIYTALLYLRSILYLLLIVVCVTWYSAEIGALQQASG